MSRSGLSSYVKPMTLEDVSWNVMTGSLELNKILSVYDSLKLKSYLPRYLREVLFINQYTETEQIIDVVKGFCGLSP